MILTEAQEKIVKYICKIEFNTLEEILMQPDLGETSMGISYEEFLSLYDATREDFDKEVVITHKEFKQLEIDPAYIFTMQPVSRNIFRQLLQLNEETIKGIYPKALLNLWNKLFLIEAAHGIIN